MATSGSDVLIACPKCGKELRLRDRSKLGRRGKCPACGHSFVLEEPEEVELELVEADAPPGAAAHWAPNEQSPPVDVPLNVDASGSDAAAGGFPPVVVSVSGEGHDTRERLRRQRSRRRKTGIIVGGVAGSLLAIVALVIVFAMPENEPAPESPRRTNSKGDSAGNAALREDFARAPAASPTDGQPIRLMHLPHGASIVIHLRPAELWSAEVAAQEFRAAFSASIVGPVEEWMRSFCRFEPAQMESLLVGLILQERGIPPRVAAVVRTVEPQKRADMIKKFPGEEDRTHGHPVYLDGERLYAFDDDGRTIAIAPNQPGVAAELAESMDQHRLAISKDGILALLKHTDRERHLTVVFQPLDLRLHQETLIGEECRDLLNLAVDWFGDDVETVAWSLHRGDEQFFSQLSVRNQHEWTPAGLQRDMEARLQELPAELYQAISKMNPQTLGARKLIGRFPAMARVFVLATQSAIGDDPRHDRFVQFTTALDERAAPNLVLASVLAWDEATRTDFSQAAPAPATGPKLPELVLDRLKKPIDLDFEREPLENALLYIGRETGVAVEVDGEALKLAGMTKNVPQTFSLGIVPAIKGVEAILGNHKKDGLCIVIDQPGKRMLVTTLAAAEKEGLTPYVVGVGE